MANHFQTVCNLGIGIDLGTSSSCVSLWKNGSVEMIPNENGNRTTPSSVAFKDTVRLVGDAANSQITRNPKNTKRNFKSLMGRKFDDPAVKEDMSSRSFKVIDIEGKPNIAVEELEGEQIKRLTPEYVTSMLYLKLRQIAEAHLGMAVIKAVITVPTGFNHFQMLAMKKAAEMAGLRILRIVSDPTAAALAHSVGNGGNVKGNVLVFNVGGGTTGVSIISMDGSVLEVKATTGDTNLGGEHFDQRLVNHFCAEVKKMSRGDIKDNPRAIVRLRRECEQAKRMLSSSSNVTIDIDALHDGMDFHAVITRNHFEELCNDLFRQTIGPVKQALKDAGMDKSEIQEVLIVGGSIRIPKIQQLLQNFFDGKELNKSLMNMEAPCQGAAILAATLSVGRRQNLRSPSIGSLLLLDVIPFSLGVETKGGVMTPIIKRNSTIPLSETKTFTTTHDKQTAVIIAVFEGEGNLTKDNHRMGIFYIAGIPKAAAGVPRIDITFDMDVNGMLELTISVSAGAGARSSSTWTKKHIAIGTAIYNTYSREEIEQTLVRGRNGSIFSIEKAANID